mgnify:CR=1 FL=1
MGRITIPRKVREEVGAKAFKLELRGNEIVLRPMKDDPLKYYGMFKIRLSDEDVDRIIDKALEEVLKDESREVHRR